MLPSPLSESHKNGPCRKRGSFFRISAQTSKRKNEKQTNPKLFVSKVLIFYVYLCIIKQKVSYDTIRGVKVVYG